MAGGVNSLVGSPGEAQLTPAPAQQNAWADYETVFTNAKAGMDGVDKDRVKQVVYEMSKGSRFFENEARKETATKERVERLKEKAAKISPEERAGFQKAADKKVVELESTRDLSHTWMHVDMDAFYASVEELHDPSLANKPMAVGGMGMICTANYEARKYGVRAAMPGFIGKRLCPQLVFAKPDFQKYTAASKEVQEVLREYDPNFIVRSLDEAYLDLTQACLDRNVTAAELAEELRAKVHQRTLLTCSAGVAPNRLLAKVCSDINKPNGQFVLPNERATVMTFITSLPTRKVTGIGKVAERVLREVLGITKCGELLERRAMIFALFSSIAFDYYMAVGLGIGGSEAPKEEHRKSISTERTFATISRDADLINKLHEIAASLAGDMAREGLHAKTLTLKLKTSRFEVRQRAVTLPTFISTAEEILAPALRLLRAEMPISIRLMGLRFSHFKEEIAFHTDPGQKTLTAFLKVAPPDLPGPSSGPENAQDDVECSSEHTGVDNRRTDSAQPSNTLPGPASLLEPGPSAQQRIADAYVKAQLATAQFVNDRHRKGGVELADREGVGSEPAKRKRDGKIDQLLGRMRRQGGGESHVEEVGCATCTFLNRGGASVCRMCGANLGAGEGAAAQPDADVTIGLSESTDLQGSGVGVAGIDAERFEVIQTENLVGKGGMTSSVERRLGKSGEATEGGGAQPGNCIESEHAYSSLRRWVGDSDQETSSPGEIKNGFTDWNEGEAEDGFGVSAPEREDSTWTDPYVRLAMVSEKEFDVVGSLRDWSIVDERPASEAASADALGEMRDGKCLRSAENGGVNRGEEKVGFFGGQEGTPEEIAGVGLRRTGEARERWNGEGLGAKRVLDEYGPGNSTAEEKASPSKRPRLAVGGPLHTESRTVKDVGLRPEDAGSLSKGPLAGMSNGISGKDSGSGGSAECLRALSAASPNGGSLVGRPDSFGDHEASRARSLGAKCDPDTRAFPSGRVESGEVKAEQGEPVDVQGARMSGDGAKRVPKAVAEIERPGEVASLQLGPDSETGAQAEGPGEASGPVPSIDPKCGAKAEQPGDVLRAGAEEARQVKCELCGEWVPALGPQRQEHADYHVALELYRSEGGRLQPALRVGGDAHLADRKRLTGPRNGDPRRLKDSNPVSRGTLDNFLKKRH